MRTGKGGVESRYPIGEYQRVRPFTLGVDPVHIAGQREIGAQIGREVKAQGLTKGKVDAVVAAVNASNPGNQIDAALRVDEAFRTLFTTSSKIHQSGPNLLTSQAHYGNGPIVAIRPDGQIFTQFADIDIDAQVGGLEGIILNYRGFTPMDRPR